MHAILFDWDGTLADSLGALFAANVAVMAAFGLPFDEARYRSHFSPDWRVMYERLGVPPERMDEANDLWTAAYEGGRRTRLLPGVRDALARLSAAGHRLGLVTAGDRGIVEPQLARLGVARYLEVAVFGTDLPAQKPDPAPLVRALDLLAADRDPAAAPDGAVYLGDTVEDVLMARAAGVRAVGIPSAIGTAAALGAAGADELVESVPAWVDRLLGPADEGPVVDDARVRGAAR
jgi:phosphoglycolate phosphatase-like HAD superfamily hydrolase